MQTNVPAESARVIMNTTHSNNPGRFATLSLPLFVCLLLCVTLFTSACAHTRRYVEPAGNANELATIQIEAPVWLVSMDGEKFSNRGWSDLKKVNVRPGRHLLQFSLAGFETVEVKRPPDKFLVRRRIHSTGPATVQLSAKPGKVYIVQHRRTSSPEAVSGKWQPFIGEFEPFDPAKQSP